MSYMYFRFHLSPHQEKSFSLLNESILNAQEAFGFIRASFDLDSTQKSISILYKSEKDILIKKANWLKFFKENNLTIDKEIQHEVLEKEVHPTENDNCLHGHTCAHGHHGHHEDQHHKHKNKKIKAHENHRQKSAIGIIYGLSLLGLSLSGLTITMNTLFFLNATSGLLTVYLGFKLYQNAWHSLKEKKMNMAMLYTISTLTILAMSIASLIIPGLPLMLESAPLILGFWHLGEAIEHTLLGKITEKLDVRDCAPKSVLLNDNKNKMHSVKKLIPNDIIFINKKEVLPVDGILTQSAFLYTTRIDGSPKLKKFKAGDPVKAGMTLDTHSSRKKIRVTNTYQNSYLSLVAKNINQANEKKAPIEMFANKILNYFVPGLAMVALTSGIAIALLFNPSIAFQSFVSILVSACPCALSLITPLAVKIGMKKISDQGVHFKDGKALQAAADIDAVVFDLNGTLTKGKVSVKKLLIKDKESLKYIALLESQSNHPVSKTIMAYLQESEGIKVDTSIKVTINKPQYHSGIKGEINGQTYLIGNIEMLRSHGIKDINQEYSDVNNGHIYMVCGDEVIGQISLTDPLRKDAIATVKQLQLMGKQVHVCTGADKESAEKYAKQLGISFENISANTVGAITIPGETSKKSYIEMLQSKGLKVAMVGDAANDLTAIAKADIGIAVKSSIGDTLTEQHAGIVIQKGLLFPIATAFDLAAKVKRNIYQNLLVSLSYNSMITLVGAGLLVSLGLTLNPAIGVGLMVLESSIVLGNVYQLKKQKPLSMPDNDSANKKDGLKHLICKLQVCFRVKSGVSFKSEQVPVAAQPVTFTRFIKRTGPVRFSMPPPPSKSSRSFQSFSKNVL